MKVILALLIFAILLVLYSVSAKAKRTAFVVGGARVTVVVADTLMRQVRGLSGQSELCPDCGMFFVYHKAKTQKFWMGGMKFPLDFVFVREGKVVEIRENVPVRGADEKITRIYSQGLADGVLEVPAGFVASRGVKVGDSASLDASP